jgi:hypothetical protein
VEVSLRTSQLVKRPKFIIILEKTPQFETLLEKFNAIRTENEEALKKEEF